MVLVTEGKGLHHLHILCGVGVVEVVVLIGKKGEWRIEGGY